MRLKSFQKLGQSVERSDEERLLELLKKLEEIQKKLATDRKTNERFAELAREQTKIVEAFEGLDPKLNRAAKKLFM